MPRNPRPVRKDPIIETIATVNSGAGAGSVPETRAVTGTSPITIDGDNSPHDLSADRTWAIDLGSVPSNMAIYGNGSDGALSLGADTTLSAGRYVFNYSSITLNGYTLTPAENECVLYCSGTLTLGGGTIRSYKAADRTIGTNTSGGGASGTGGGAIGALFVFAKTISGTGSIHANGVNGGDAAGATEAYANTTTDNATTHQSGTNVLAFYGNAYTPGNAGNGSTGGDGGASGSPPTTLQRAVTKNPMAWLFITSTHTDTSASKWWAQAMDAAAGESGSSGTQAWGPVGGGGGAGGCSPAANGGNGGKSARVSGAGDSAAGGGGGGGGSAGCICVVMTNTAPSTLTVSANGGDGGDGGISKYSGGTAVDCQSSGGGGGGGGVAILVAQYGCTATVSATGGAGGLKGTATSGTANDGVAGGSGYSVRLSR